MNVVPEYYYLYCIVEEDNPNGPCKVGVATNLVKRMSGIQCGNWRQLKFAWSVKIKDRDNALNVEQRILIHLRPSIYCNDSRGIRRLKSEWVDASPAQAYEAGRLLYDVYKEEEVAA